MKTTKVWFYTAFISTLLSLATHGYLSLQSYRLKSGDIGSKSVCNLNSQFNCDAVALSSYSEFAGVPVAVWGFATNALLFILLFTVVLNISINGDRVRRASLLTAGLILAASIGMAAISFTQMSTYCLFCISVYVLSVVQFISVYKIQETPFFKSFKDDVAGVLTEQRWILVAFIGVPAFAVLGHSMASDSYGLKQADWLIKESVQFWQTAPKNDFKEDQGLALQSGTGTPKMVIVEFADFLCPHCKTASTPLHTFTESKQGVKLIFKPFPLDGTCNAAIQQKGDGLRCELAAATLCAEKINGKGWAAQEWIFARQSQMFGAFWKENFESFNQHLGSDSKAMRECIDSPETKDLVFKVADEGAKAQIRGTPTIFVNGKQLDRGQMVPVLEAVFKLL